MRRLRTSERSLLHPDTIALSSRLVPHARYFEAAELYEELALLEDPAPSQAEEVAEGMAAAGEGFRELGLDEEFFLTLVYTAQARERVGEQELAMEAWLMAVESRFWPSANDDVRMAIAGRVTSYRQRLLAEVEDSVRDRWEAHVAEIEAGFAERHGEAMRRIDELEVARARLQGQLDAERARAPSSAPSDAGSYADAGESILDGLDVLTDVVSLAQVFRGTRRR